MDGRYHIVRVELHEGDDGARPSYDELHRRLAQNEFYRTIKDSDSGEWFWLPDATYVSRFSADSDRVYARAAKVVKGYWVFSGIVVVPTDVVHFEGLRAATADDRATEIALRRSEMARIAALRRR